MVQKKKYDIGFFKQFAIKKGGECLSDDYNNCKVKLEFSCSKKHVWMAEPRHIIEGRWCPECGKQAGRLYDVNHSFFSELNEKSCYIAGFLAADGWVSYSSDGGYSIGLKLATKDIKHLEKIKKELSCTSPIKIRERYRDSILGNKIDKTLHSCSLKIHSKQIFNDLEKFSVFPNKTYYIRFPEILKDNIDMFRHYLRGYIDGDGCFYEKHDIYQKNSIAFTIQGTKEFLEEVHNILFKNNICNTSGKKKQFDCVMGTKFLAFDTLCYGGNNQVSRLYDFLYKDATIFLERKEEIAKKSKELKIYGTNKKRKSRDGVLNITKEDLLQKAAELKSGKKIADFYGCTNANISYLTKFFNVREEYHKAIGKSSKEDIYQEYLKTGNANEVGRKFNLTGARIKQIVDEIGKSK